MLINAIISYLTNIKELKIISQQETNRITDVDTESFFIETKDSIAKYHNGESDNPRIKVAVESVKLEIERLLESRQLKRGDVASHQGRSTFICSLIAQLPFVRASYENESIIIRLREFQTDELPSEQYQKVIKFLEEIIDEKYEPATLSSQIQGNLYRVKSRGRQDLRMLGFLDGNHTKNIEKIEGYISNEDKSEFMKRIVQKLPYFKVVIELLKGLTDYTKREKQQILSELAMYIVRNSIQGNLMKESVSKERTHNLLIYLEEVGLIDEEWNLMMDGQIRTKLLRVMNEYLPEKNTQFKANELGSFVRNDLVESFKNLSIIDNDKYIIKASVGQGNWAQVPWLAIMHKDITTTTQEGYYIVYLFSEDMERLYLTLAQGVTNNSKEQIEYINQDIRRKVIVHPNTYTDNALDLGISNKAIGYRNSTALYIPYEKDRLPSEEQLQEDLSVMLNYYEEYINKSGQTVNEPASEMVSESDESIIDHIYSFIESKGFYYKKDEVKNLFLSLRTKPFVILSGISGTGKTKIIELFAESLGATEENGQFKLVPVRPDWSDGSDILGYVDIKGDFQAGPLTTFIQRAQNDKAKPYFVVLDEMNLARVEYYFSDFLSVIESRKWKDGEITTSSLLQQGQLDNKLTIPPNLYVIGTVNMDETTHPFSKKVLDRANMIEFNEVLLDHFNFSSTKEPSPKLIPNERIQSKYLHLKDAYDQHQQIIHDVTERLVELNKLLIPIHAHIGYRVRDEICFYLIYSRYLMGFENAFDYQLHQKILPRITASEPRAFNVLESIYKYCTNHQFEEEEPENQEEIINNAKYPKSAKKVYEMLRRGQIDGFTSFWGG
ncbi:McrB family protein [Virgibacillus xinjiangensis]|uniref:McrB family protein n=1 Tax=Virgibacillus xinjiangensis TaxID=393090 RepID=A0ABV7CYR2_9BACI